MMGRGRVGFVEEIGTIFRVVLFRGGGVVEVLRGYVFCGFWLALFSLGGRILR